jgi:hypothetical protein
MECAMTTTDLLNQKIKNLPESLVKELLDFAEFLEQKWQKQENLPKKRVFGCSKGKYKLADDFDAPLDDFKDYM